MITEIKVGDYIEKSELDTEQKYNDVVEVFESFGIDCLDYKSFKDESPSLSLFVISDGYLDTCVETWKGKKRKLTYDDIMQLNKVDWSKADNARDKLKEIASKAKSEMEKDGKKYHREIIGFCGTKVEVDVYRVLDAYNTGSASIDHAIKKLLCTGLRGHKDFVTDIDNAIESLEEAKMLYLQKREIDNA